MTAGETSGVKVIYSAIVSNILILALYWQTHVVLLLEPPVSVKHALRVMMCLIAVDVVVIGSLYFQTLWCWRNHIALLLGEEGRLLFFKSPLLLLELPVLLLDSLLLQELNLRIDFGNSIVDCGVMRRKYLRGD